MEPSVASTILGWFVPGLTAATLTSVPAEAKNRLRARWGDVVGTTISVNYDLIRAGRLAWIEAAMPVLDAVEETAAGDPEHHHIHDVHGQTAALAHDAKQRLIGIRTRAFNRQIPVGESPIDAQLAHILDGVAELIAPGPDDDLGQEVTDAFPVTLAAILERDVKTLPNLFERKARAGIPTAGGGPPRPFGELAFAAFAELLKDPKRYPEARTAFHVTMAKQLADLQLTILELLQTELPEIRADIERSARFWHGIEADDGREDLGLRDPEAIRARPAQLLLARFQVVPFLDRGLLEAEALEWMVEPARQRCRGRLYVAPGGAGKTRLAIEMLGKLTEGGWRCTFLAERSARELGQAAFTDLLATPNVEGVCVVVDYAEGHLERLRQLTDAAAMLNKRGETGPPVRLLAFARSAAGWWDGFAREPSPASVFDPAPRESLDPALSLDEGRALFAGARTAFLGALRDFEVAPEGPPRPEPNLDEARFARPLAIVAAAFLAARGRPVTEESVFETLYQEERANWRRALDRCDDDDPRLTDLARAVAQVTLVQGASEDGVRALVKADTHDDRELSGNRLLPALRRLYGRAAAVAHPDASTEVVPFIAQIEPDLLGEHLVMRVLADGGDGLVGCTMRTALAGPPLYRGDPSAIVTIVSRATHPDHDDRVHRSALEAAGQLERFVNELGLQELTALRVALPEASLALSSLGVEVERVLATQYRELVAKNRDAYLPDLAMALNNLGIRLDTVGRRDEALTATEEAVTLRRELVANNRDAYLTDLAMALNNFGNRLNAVGRRDEAITATEEAVTHYEQLVANNRDAYLPNRAIALNNFGNRLDAVGRRDEALTATEEAVTHYRELVAKNRDAYLADLAGTLSNLGIRLDAVGRRDEALTTTEEAVTHYRELVANNRDAYLPALAMALNNFGNRLDAVGRRDEALTATEEAVTLRRELVANNRDAYLPNLAMALGGLSSILVGFERFADALCVAEDCVASFREVVGRYRRAHLHHLAAALDVLARVHDGLGREAEAATAREEAAALRRELDGSD